MNAVFDTARRNLDAIFESLQNEHERIANLDAHTASKQQHVDNLAEQERELQGRIRQAHTTLNDLETAISVKLEQHDSAKRDLEAVRTHARKVLAG